MCEFVVRVYVWDYVVCVLGGGYEHVCRNYIEVRRGYPVSSSTHPFEMESLPEAEA